MDLLGDFGLLAGLGVLATLIAVPIVRRIAEAFALYDRPDEGLKPHEKPVPYLGGVAIWIGWLAVLLAGMVLVAARAGLPDAADPAGGTAGAPGGYWNIAWVVLGGSVLMLTGLIDDVRHLPPRARLLIQAAVAGLLVCAGIGRGVSAALLGADLGGWNTGVDVGLILDGVFCIVVLAGATNSTNLIDGMDGLCAGILGIAALGLLVMAALLSWRSGDGGLWISGGASGPAHHGIMQVVLCAAVLGACIGFLRHNFNPASMFMGDSGSLLLGFNAAVLMILLVEEASWRGLVGAAVVFGFPIFDTALAIARRKLNGRPLFVGDRSHFYDQLCDRGHSVRKSVTICYVIGLISAASGCALMFLPTAWVVVVVVVGPILAGTACRRFGMLRVDDAAERSQGDHPIRS